MSEQNPASHESPEDVSSRDETSPPKGRKDRWEPLFPVVGVGASAGGLDALKKFFSALPPDTGMAYVVIQHLDPHQVSHLPELLGNMSRMPVLVAQESQRVEQNKVYVIPPNKTLTIEDDTLCMSARPHAGHIPQPFNVFLSSLARDRQHLSIAVVLSGTGTDGTLGVGEIKSVGGITFAQDEESAMHTGMPVAAAQSGHVDYVLPPDKIAQELVRISAHPLIAKAKPPSEDESQRVISSERDFDRILSILKNRNNVDFTQYRESTLKRRILRRMVIRKIETLSAYTKIVEDDPAESHALFHDLLINVTSFFRDPEMFEELKQKVYPEILAAKQPNDTIRIWVIGCSTGQETYSLAISLLEFLDHKTIKPSVQLFATDISDPHALNVARAGLYPDSIRAEMSQERLHRFFTREESGFRILKSVREMCVFARQNVIADPPFSRIDLLSCRNVLIYLSNATQRKLLPLFHYALNVPGFLALGMSESIGSFTDLFSVVDKKHRIFSRTPIHTRDLPPFHIAQPPGRPTFEGQFPAKAPVPPRSDVQAEADRILLQRFAPGGVVVNSDLDILHFRGRTSPWLEPPHGDGRLNIVNMACQSLFLEIRQAVRDSRESGRKVRKSNVRAADASGDRVNIEIIPIRPRQGTIESFLVVFEAASTDANPSPAPVESVPVDKELQQLRDELTVAHEYIQSIIEQQDASTEELKSANEEIMSANEELQSTNEELETAKEELQSTNEELTTLNQELQTRNFELAQLTDDLLNLLTSLRIPIVMLTADLRIRRYTPGSAKFFNLLPTDIGRPLHDVHSVINVPNLSHVILNVIADVTTFEQEVQDRDGRWFLLRIAPYRTSENKIDGAVLMLLDIHSAKTSAQQVQEAATYTKDIIAALNDPLLLLDEHFRIESANQAYCNLVDCSPGEVAGLALYKAHDALWNNPELRDRLARVIDQRRPFAELVIERVFPKAGERAFKIRARLLTTSGGAHRILLSFHDITDLQSAAQREKQLSDAERAARMEAEQANRIKDQFLAMLSHELRNPLNSVLGWTRVLKTQPQLKSEKLQEALESIESATRSQVRMIGDLLDISRIASGKMQLDLRTVDLHEVTDKAVQLFVPAAQAKNIQLERHFESDRLNALVDPERMQQVVSNLISNAIKFTPEGGRIEIELKDVDHSAEITVRDSGPGFPPDFQKHLFETFRQADASATRSGLGLGLAIVKHLVTLHGGSVQARNGEKGGAEFKVIIPHSEIHFPAFKDEDNSQKVAPRGDGPNLAGLRVLIVDDDPDACAIARRIFEDHKMKAFIALSAHEGLNLLKHEHPDVIVSDIGMPDQDGYELMKQIRKLPESQGGKVPAIALTAFARSEDRKQALAVGYQKHLAKPVDPLELLTVIATLTSTRKK